MWSEENTQDRYFVGFNEDFDPAIHGDWSNHDVLYFDRPQRIRIRQTCATAHCESAGSDNVPADLYFILAYIQEGMPVPPINIWGSSGYDVYDPAVNCIWWTVIPLSSVSSNSGPTSGRTENYGREMVINCKRGDFLTFYFAPSRGDNKYQYGFLLDVDILD